MLKIGIIGCGYWGPNLIRNFVETPAARVTWLCDLNEGVLSRLKTRYPSVKTTTDYRLLLKSPDLDAVAIATPVEHHYEMARAALDAGKHVLVEKPLAASSKDAEKLIALAKERGLTLQVDHTFVYSAPVQTLKRYIGDIGELRYFDSTRVNLGLFQKDINVIWDLAPHDFSILLYLLDQEPETVLAVGAGHVNAQVENTAYVMAEFQNNFISHFHFNWLSPVKVRQTLICGTKKMIVYNDLDSVEPIRIYDYGIHHRELDKHAMMVDYRVGDIFSPRVPPHEALSQVTRDFVSSILEKRSPISDGKFGLRILRLLEACDESLQRKSVFVNLSDVTTRHRNPSLKVSG